MFSANTSTVFEIKRIDIIANMWPTGKILHFICTKLIFEIVNFI